MTEGSIHALEALAFRLTFAIHLTSIESALLDLLFDHKLTLFVNFQVNSSCSGLFGELTLLGLSLLDSSDQL